MSASQACLAYVDVQNEYAEKDGTAPDQHLCATHRKQPAKTQIGSIGRRRKKAEGPLVELSRRPQGRATGSKQARRMPFHGYYFKILTKQGRAPSGGEFGSVADGKMIGGVSLSLRILLSTGTSGVMTFIVDTRERYFQSRTWTRTRRGLLTMTHPMPDRELPKISDQ